MTRTVHVITPGDHFSPRTGSAIPTVVHGLCSAAPTHVPRPVVVVARHTYPDRYDSADLWEYDEVPPARWDRLADAVTSRVGMGRPRTRRRFAAAVTGQGRWEPSVILAHNAPQLVATIDPDRHAAVLYAHNDLLRTYSITEAGRALDNAHRIVCVSEFLAERTRERLPASLRQRVVVVRNGVDNAFFGPADRGTHADLRVTFVGRMVPDKGADVLVEAVRRTGRADVRLTIVGSEGFDAGARPTAFASAVRAAAAALPTPATVLPFVPRDQVADILRGSDVVVVPSRWPEPFALTSLEGMASGAAVVASSTGGIPEAVGDGGVLVPPEDPSALAAVLTRFAEDRDALHDARSQAGDWARGRDWSRVARELDDIVGTLAPGGAP